jgi:membrane-bound lytic murein transglycosylase D
MLLSINKACSLLVLKRALFVSVILFATGCSFIGVNSDISDDNQQATLEELLKSKVDEPRASLYLPPPKINQLPEPNLDVTPEVKHHMRAYGGHRARFIQSALEQRDKHYPLLVQIFEDEGVPATMLNLALIESGFRNEARSPVGAVGMWQFMKSTAKLYGLKVGLFVDERKDPILSTIAAARHLRDLYNQYGDWHLVLAAYNAGTGGLDRALSRSGHRNFWQVARSGVLTRQTAEFVPKFIAASLLVNSAMAERNLIDQNKQFASLAVVRK